MVDTSQKAVIIVNETSKCYYLTCQQPYICWTSYCTFTQAFK